VLGYSQEEFLKHYTEYLTDNPVNKEVEHRTNLSIQGVQQPPYEVEIYHKDGSIRRLEVTEFPVFDNKGNVVAVEGLAHDITERRRMEEGLKALSLNDGLTGLYNRRGFITLAEQQLKFADRVKRGTVLLFADLDGLKLINDSFGHREGDRALIDTAYLLKNTFRGSDIIARIGGDEFVVLALDTHEAYCEVLISRLKKNISVHNTDEGRPYKLMLSVGTAPYDPENPCTIEQLLERADKMMYEEKQRKLKT
jgi:diguanylate cyclase (GGDEF)-like protein/PAS domain S-box-containing protein